MAIVCSRVNCRLLATILLAVLFLVFLFMFLSIRCCCFLCTFVVYRYFFVFSVYVDNVDNDIFSYGEFAV